MKNFVMIFLGLVLVLATLEADGKQLTLEEERELILSGQASIHKLGRKGDVGAKDDPDVGLLDSLQPDLNSSLQHRYFINGTNPWAPRHKP
ncbi:hypothetical protein PTKIN_Ptkin09bG0006800 [Pterospermum kingtungense]